MTNPRRPASASNSAQPAGSAPAPDDAVLSPAFATEGPPAYEVKFLLDEAQAQAVEAWARAHLSLDTHGDPALAGSYEVSTLYLDTPAFDVFHDAQDLEGAKFRLRRYGSGSLTFLERKRRRGNQVQKRRTPVAAQELRRLGSSSAGADWPGGWFQDAVEARAFRPTCRLTYLRTAFYHPTDAGHLRLTLDRNIRCSAAMGWSAGRVHDAGASSVAEGLVVCELKFRAAMPQAFKQLVAETGLTAGRFSKYRRACLAMGLINGTGADDA